MPKILLLLFMLLPFLAQGQRSGHNGAPKYAPEDGKKLLVIGQDIGSVGGLTSYTNGYIDNLNQIPAGVTSYTGFPGLPGLKTKANWGAGDIHAQAYSDDEDFNNTFIVIGLNLVGQLKKVTDGSSDYYVAALGQWIKDQARPVFLRIGYEFDGSWNNYNPDDYKNAWIYLVHSFDEMDIRNVAYVWQSAGINTPNIDRWYPGDEYVNWVGYSHFDEPNPGQVMRDFADVHNKPIMIAEATPRKDLKTGSGEAHWNAWYGPLFEKIYESDRIKALAYINADWESQSMWTGQGWGDSRVEINDVVKTNWLGEMAKDNWLLASNDLFETLQYQKWQDLELITGINDESTDNNLTVMTKDGNVLISAEDDRMLNGIRFWDFYGRELYADNDNSREYLIPMQKNRLEHGVIMSVFINNQWIQKKLFICPSNL